MFAQPDRWLRYIPGVAAALGGAAFIGLAPSRRKVAFTTLATLLGLVCMEAEYWVARGFPESEVTFFVGALAVTLTALVAERWAGLALGAGGLVFFAYVNTRYGAPYLLDYVMPAFYAVLVAYCRRDLRWHRAGILAVGRMEAIWLLLANALAIWRTTALGKWGWLAGGDW